MKPNSDNSIHSRPGHSTEPFTVSTDVAQWRQDVRAFTVATRQMLDSVQQELSSGLASGQAQVNIVHQNTTTLMQAEQRSTLPSQDTLTSSVSPSQDNATHETDQLLAKLKAQLAEQMNQ